MNKTFLRTGLQGAVLTAAIGCEGEIVKPLPPAHQADQISVDLSKEDNALIRSSTNELKELRQRCKVRAHNELSLLTVEENDERSLAHFAAGYELETEKGTQYVFRRDDPYQQFFILTEADQGLDLLRYTFEGESVEHVSGNHYPSLDIDSQKDKLLGPLQLSTTSTLKGTARSKDLAALSEAFNDLKADCPSHLAPTKEAVSAYSSNIFPDPALNGWENRVVRKHKLDLENGVARVAMVCNVEPSKVADAYRNVVQENHLSYTPAPLFRMVDGSGLYSMHTGTVILNGGEGEQEVLFHEMTHALNPIQPEIGYFSVIEEGTASLITGMASLPKVRNFVAYSIESLLTAALGPKVYCARFKDPGFHYSLAEWSKENSTIQALADDFSERWGIQKKDRADVRAIFAPTEALRGTNTDNHFELSPRLLKLKSILKENDIDWDIFLESTAPAATGFMDEGKVSSWKKL